MINFGADTIVVGETYRWTILNTDSAFVVVSIDPDRMYGIHIQNVDMPGDADTACARELKGPIEVDGWFL